MKLEQVIVAVSRADGPVAFMAFLTVGRGNVLPSGAHWLHTPGEDATKPASGASGWWSREPTELAIMREIEACPETPGGAGITGWRVLKTGEVPADRTYRNALIDTGTAIVHDMDRARAVHRGRIRAQRNIALAELDAQWMRATGQGKKAKADAIEAERQQWRDAPADPRITEAQTTEKLAQIVNGG